MQGVDGDAGVRTEAFGELDGEQDLRELAL
jgi:hypothetical protein